MLDLLDQIRLLVRELVVFGPVGKEVWQEIQQPLLVHREQFANFRRFVRVGRKDLK